MVCRPRYPRALPLAALIVLLLAACAPSPGGAARDTILLGATVPTTGQMAKEGEYTRDGYLLAIETINARGGVRVGNRSYRLALRYYDDESRPERTAELYEKLIAEDRVDFLLGPYSSLLTAAAVPLANQHGIPMLAAHGAAESLYAQGNRYAFGIVSPAREYLSGIIDVVVAQDPAARRVALLGEDAPFAREVLDGAAQHARGRGMAVVYRAFYPVGTPDASDVLGAAWAQRPDLLLSAGHLQDAILIVRQAKALGVTPKALGFSVGPSAPEFRRALRADADYIFGATQWTEALGYHGDDPWATPQAYAAAFHARFPDYGEIPYHAAESSAGIFALARAIEQARSLDRNAVREALAGLDLRTFYGPIRFDARGMNVSKPMAIEQLQPDGRKYTIYPGAVAERDALYPMPPWDRR